jgi:hypothetical protein
MMTPFDKRPDNSPDEYGDMPNMYNSRGQFSSTEPPAAVDEHAMRRLKQIQRELDYRNRKAAELEASNRALFIIVLTAALGVLVSLAVFTVRYY